MDNHKDQERSPPPIQIWRPNAPTHEWGDLSDSEMHHEENPKQVHKTKPLKDDKQK